MKNSNLIYYLVFIFITLHFCVLAIAPNYSNVNLIESKNKYFSNLPVYNQGPLNTCYSFSASTMVDYYRLSHGEKISTFGDLTSPLWLASNYKKYNKKTDKFFNLFNRNNNPFFDVGTAAFAINQANITGFCSLSEADKSLQSLLNKFNSIAGTNLEGISFIEFMSKFLNDIDDEILNSMQNSKFEASHRTSVFPAYMFKRNYEFEAPSSLIKQCNSSSSTQIKNFLNVSEIINELNDQINSARDNTIVAKSSNTTVSMNEYFKSLAFQNVIQRYLKNTEAMKDSKKKEALLKFINLIWTYHNQVGYLQKIISSYISTCKTRQNSIKIPDAQWDFTLYSAPSELKPKVNLLLTRKNPQPIELDFCYGVLTSNDEKYDESKYSCNYHSALIVGQRWKNNNIQYLIQDSTGIDCAQINKKWECIPNHGATWIDADLILSKSIFMSWL